MTLRIERNKWILYRHTSNFNLLCEVAQILKSYSKATITKNEKLHLSFRLQELGLYNERNPDMPLDAINHKINQLSYYMFGYQAKTEGVDRFMFSPLGNLLLKNINSKSKASKIFITMLWSMQFQHPHSSTNKEFQLYPFRLEIGGEYTIVVTPRYVPAAKRDIIGTPNVIILASTFAEYLYNCIDHDLREIDYEDFDNIIIKNLGKDISKDVSNLTISKFAINR